MANTTQYIEYLQKIRGLSDRSVYHYLTYHRHFMDKNINQNNITKFLISKGNNGVCRAYMRSYLEFLQRDKEFDLPHVKTGGKKKRLIRQISKVEINKISDYAYAKRIREGIIFDLLYYGALRRAEILSIKTNSFNWGKWFADPIQHMEFKVIGKGNKERKVLANIKAIKSLLQLYFNKGIINAFMKPQDIIEKLNSMNDPLFNRLSEWKVWEIVKRCSTRALQRDIRTHEIRHCVDEDCEILTINGWRRYNEISVGDNIFSYNIEKDIIEKDIIEKINTYTFDGYLNRIKNNYLDYLFTDEHKLPLNILKGKQVNGKNNDYWLNEQLLNIKELAKIKNKRSIKHKLSSCYDGELSIGKSRAGILGWILTDGSISKRKHPSISISQSISANKEKVNYIEKLLKNGDIPFTKTICNPKCTFSNKNMLIANFQILKGGNNGNNPNKMGKTMNGYLNL